MTFKPNAYLDDALRKGDIRQIQGALLGYADGDPAFRDQEFFAALAYVKKIRPEVFVIHDPSIFADDSKSLKDQYYDVRTGLTFNFSEERLAKLVELGRKCMGDAEVYTVTGTNNRVVFRPESTQDFNTGKKAESQNQRMAAALKIGLVCVAAVLVVIVILIPLLMKIVR